MNYSVQPAYLTTYGSDGPTPVRIIDQIENMTLDCFCERCSSATDHSVKTAKDLLDSEPAKPFSDFEWRFFECPEEQQHWCDIYEYTRNNPRAVEAVAQYRFMGHWFQKALIPNPCQQQLACRFFDAFPEFPKMPFLAIEGRVRRMRCAKLDKERLNSRARLHPIKTKLEVSKGTLVWEVAEDITEQEWHRIWLNFNGKQGRRRVAADRLGDLSLLQLYRFLKSWDSVLEFVTEKGICQFSDKPDHLCRCGNRALKDMKSVFRRIL